MFKPLFIAFNVMAVLQLAQAQTYRQTIRGLVLEESTKIPIPFAVIKILGSNPAIGTYTDADGVFFLPDIKIGRYDIEFSSAGYETKIVYEQVLSASKELVLKVTLKDAPITGDDVIVRPNLLKEIPINQMAMASARMLSVEEAKRYAGGFDDPARLASSFAGVASNIGNNGIVIRGNSPKFLQWKLEGVEIPNPNHFADLASFGGGGLTALSSNMLANSDFFTGAFPAEYTNALSGVFDMSMRNGNNHESEHSLQVGLIGIDLFSEGPISKDNLSSYIINYRYSTLGLLEPLLPEDAGGTSYQDLSFKLNFPTQTSGIFSIWGMALVDRSGQEIEKDSTKQFYDQDLEEQAVKQYVGTFGLNYQYHFNGSLLKTQLNASFNGLDLTSNRLHKSMIKDYQLINNSTWNLVLSSSLNTKFNQTHLNQTGFNMTSLNYNLSLNKAVKTLGILEPIVAENGSSYLISAYTNSMFNLSNNLSLTIGLASQLFTLNNLSTLEPRLGLKWELNANDQISLAYGLHSRLERLNYYFSKDEKTKKELNKDLDFSKAQHIVFNYSSKLSEKLLLKIEPYYQWLYSIPVIADSSFSFINLQNEWFINKQLNNLGLGENFGVDVTLEQYLDQGFYYMITASFFNSSYRGDDSVWRNTRYNKNFLLNVLLGKEWNLGSAEENVLSVNTRFTLQGGDRYTPINKDESKLAKETVFNEDQAFSEQFSNAFTMHLTVAYKINNEHTAHEIALKILNVTAYKDFTGFNYNYKTQAVDKREEAIIIPNLSYKYEF